MSETCLLCGTWHIGLHWSVDQPRLCPLCGRNVKGICHFLIITVPTPHTYIYIFHMPPLRPQNVVLNCLRSNRNLFTKAVISILNHHIIFSPFPAPTALLSAPPLSQRLSGVWECVQGTCTALPYSHCVLIQTLTWHLAIFTSVLQNPIYSTMTSTEVSWCPTLSLHTQTYYYHYIYSILYSTYYYCILCLLL